MRWCRANKRAPASPPTKPHLGGGGAQADLGLAATLPVRQRRRLPQLVQPLHGTHRRVRALRPYLQGGKQQPQ